MSIAVSFSHVGSCPDEALTFVVIAAKVGDQHVFCQHRKRSTWECPGGHIESGETPAQAAKRELYEETGCKADALEPVCIYSVSRDGDAPSHGMLFRAHISQLGEVPEDFEMKCVRLFDGLPESWTYPDIQPHLLRRAWER